MVEQDVGNGEGIGQLAVPDEGHRADHPDALFPDGFSVAGQFVKQVPVFVQQPFAQQRIAGQVHQIPIVNRGRMCQVKVHTLLLQRQA